MASNEFHTGFWINWNKGHILGPTLTVPTNYGNVIIAFLALFVTWSGSQLWVLLCFWIHQIRSTQEERDGLHHQIQAIMTTGMSDLTMSWRFLQLCRCWRNRTTRVLYRTLPLVLLCVVHFVVIALAGLFSSRVANTTDIALISGQKACGWYDTQFLTNKTRDSPMTDEDINSLDSLMISTRTAAAQARVFSRTCYPRIDGFVPDTSSAPCSATVVPYINSTINLSVACPFATELCEGTAVSLDSGYIDSLENLGINEQPQNRIKFRRITTCAPVPMERNYSSDWLVAPNFPGLEFKGYFLGETPGQEFFPNATYVIDNMTIPFSVPYQPSVFTYYAGNEEESGFVPIEALLRTDADVSVMGILNNVVYSREINDTVFGAHSAIPASMPFDTDLWTADTSMTALGCVEQYQLCNSRECTDLGGLYQFANETNTKSLELNEIQKAIVEIIWRSLFFAQLFYECFLLDTNMLLASDRIASFNIKIQTGNSSFSPASLAGLRYYSSPLSDNQWQQEVEQIQNTALAMVQQLVLEHVAQPDYVVRPGVHSSDYLISPGTESGKQLCLQQVFRSSSYLSFNVFGLIFLILTGFLIICLSYIIPTLAEKWQLWSEDEAALYRLSEWKQDDVLQLLRAAISGQDSKTWTGKDESVPVTTGFAEKMKWHLLTNTEVSTPTYETSWGAKSYLLPSNVNFHPKFAHS